MPESDETTKLLRALLALAVDDREQRARTDPSMRRTELLLNDAGLDSSEIAALTGKQAGSVRMAISRARKSGKSDKGEQDG